MSNQSLILIADRAGVAASICRRCPDRQELFGAPGRHVTRVRCKRKPEPINLCVGVCPIQRWDARAIGLPVITFDNDDLPEEVEQPDLPARNARASVILAWLKEHERLADHRRLYRFMTGEDCGCESLEGKKLTQWRLLLAHAAARET